ncbi:MAG: ATP-binding domain-containing protein [Coriobacteriales bacterium]|nr:ATP-binding domain-containing protein [Coriobacteriales bacterium]
MEPDSTFYEEQEHLDEVYNTILALRDELAQELEVHQAEMAQDLRDMSDELRPDVAGIEADEAMETLAAIETLNSVIDAYNQRRDFAMERMQRVLALIRQPYFAKVRLQMRPGRPARDVYIGAVGLMDNSRNPIVVDWRSPVAETYYKQENGPTSFVVDGRVRNVVLELRRQFDIERNVLRMYFDTTVAIQDSLLLGALKRHHTQKLQAITATIQSEQNEVVRHADVPALLVSGIAGSGKTSVLLQRIAYLFYQEREHLRPEHVSLFTPNAVFEHYIDSVLPSLGETNPRVYTWRTFVEEQGLGGRDAGAHTDPESLRALEDGLQTLQIEPGDLHDIRMDGEVLLKTSQIASALQKFSQFPFGPRRLTLTRDELHDRLERRFSTLARREDLQERMLLLDVDEQSQIFGETIDPSTQKEVVACTRTYVEHLFASAHDRIDSCEWLRFDRIGSRMLGGRSLSACEWLWLRLVMCGYGAKETRYVYIDEVQDYTVSQLMLLARFYSRAHFLLLGDANQAIREGTASWDEIRDVFASACGGVDECALRTSYRSSPEITSLFSSLLTEEERGTLSSVRRAGVMPRIEEFGNTEDYVAALRDVAERAEAAEGLTAIVAADGRRVSWLSKQLGDRVRVVRKSDVLPESGVVLLDLSLAKGLEFDHVVVPDAQEEVYANVPLARRRLYTAISRAMHEVTVFSQGSLTPLLGEREGQL